MGRQAENLRQKSGELRDLREKRMKLAEEVEKLKIENDREAQQRAIDDLEREKALLEKEKRDMADRQKKLRSTIEEVKKELKSQEKKMRTEEETRALRDLLKNFPVDVEETT